MSDLVRLEKPAEGVALLTIDRPPVNALSAAVIDALETAARELTDDASIRAVVVTGAGEKAFVAGADIKEFPGLTRETGEILSQRGQTVFDRIAGLPYPSIAAVNGFALGGGMELALACDIRLASPGIKLGQPEVTLGIIPGYGGTQRLPRLVGTGAAKRLIYSGEMIGAKEALAIGLVDAVVEEGTVLEAALKLASTIASRGPVAVRAAKEAIDRGLEVTLAEGLALEAALFGRTCSTEDKNEGVAAFLEKRPPRFQDR
ncbi:MAG: enoyl-CoA hydratase/isomerase family protein [Firmicutes bacterium]|nr:enoyl-CoA hydratase/isomerase family protein [Bacillota bacterium]